VFPGGRIGREEKMKKVSVLWAVAAILPLMSLGCVPYQKYETLKRDYTRVKSAHDDLIVKYNRAIQDILRLQGGENSREALEIKCANLERLKNDLEAQLSQLSQGRKFTEKDIASLPNEVQMEGTGISLGEHILFNSGQEKLKDARARKILDSIISLLKTQHPNDVIHISGHTDTDPIKNSKWGTNQRLSYERAHTIFRYFKDMGIPEDMMVLHSFSYIHPVDPGTTAEAKAKNRRVVIHLGGTKI